MKKLKKEDVYINLQGNSEDELTELYNFLKLLNYDIDSFDSFFTDKYLHFNTNCDRWWTFSKWDIKPKQEVTIQQLKEILQPMENNEFEKLLNYAKSVDFKISDLTAYINEVISHDYYGQLKGDEPEDKAYLFILKYKDIELSLEQQLEKAKAEVKRIEQEIKEHNKPKIGDWVVSELNNCVFKYQYGRLEDDLTKITDQELINKLNDLINER